MLTLWLQGVPSGPSLVAFRIGNVLVHAACGLLLLWLLMRLGLAPPVSLVVAWSFLSHPSVTETVMWLTGRHDSLGVLFCLGALLVWPRGPAGPWAVAGASLLCGAAFLSKEPYIVAPALVVLLDVWRHRRDAAPLRWSRVALWCAPAAGVIAVLILRRLLQIPSGSDQLLVSPLTHALHFATIVKHYVVQLVTFSNGPTIDSYRPLTGAASVVVLAAIVAVAGVLAYLWRRGASVPGGALLGLLWLVVALAPHIVSIPVLGKYGNRYAYLPWVGLAIGLAFALDAVLRRLPMSGRGAVLTVIMLGVGAQAWATSLEAAHWRDDRALYGADVARSPEDAQAIYHLGHAIRRQQGCEAALPHFRSAVGHDPELARAWHEIGWCLLSEGRHAESIEPSLRAIRLGYGPGSTFHNLGVALVRVGRVEDGIRSLEESLRRRPGNAGTLAELRAARERLASAGTEDP
jgi:hypothetical protein